MLNHQHTEQFREEGYVAVEGVFRPSELAELRNSAQGIVAKFDPRQELTVFKTTDRDAGRDEAFFASAEVVHCFLEEEALDESGKLRVPVERAINKIGHALHDHVPEFKAFCSQPGIGNAFRSLGQAQPILWQTMYIFKQPGIGGEVRWHQDASYLISQPASVTGMWIALEDATRENGCLWVAPGGHKGPLRELYTVNWTDRTGTLRTCSDVPWPGESEGLALEVPAGSVVFFSDHMPHYSSANRSPRSRQALTLHAADEASNWAAENWLQRKTLPPFRL